MLVGCHCTYIIYYDHCAKVWRTKQNNRLHVSMEFVAILDFMALIKAHKTLKPLVHFKYSETVRTHRRQL